MNETIDKNRKAEADDVEIELPLVKITKSDVLGALFVHTGDAKELYKDALLKLQTWIVNFAEEQVKPLRESGKFTDAEIDSIKKKTCVISPITLTLYIHWLQMEEFVKMSDSKKEKFLLEKIPDRFKARYRGNASCRNAREVTAEEEAAKMDDETSNGSSAEEMRRISFVEFLKEFGAEIRKELDTLERKE